MDIRAFFFFFNTPLKLMGIYTLISVGAEKGPKVISD